MQNIGGVWMTPGEAGNLRKSIRIAKRNAEKWRPKTQELVRVLESKDPKRRKHAIERYHQGLDGTAILSIENLLSTRSKPFALLAVKFIGDMPDYEATQSLVRHAVHAEETAVRIAAVEQLATREQQDSVPLLLSQLSNPLKAGYGIAVGPFGMVRQTQQIMEQGRDANTRHVYSTARGIHDVNRVQFNVNRRGAVQSVTTTDDAIVALHLAIEDYDTVEERLAAESALRRRFALQRQQLLRQEVLRAAGLNRSLQYRNQRSSAVNERTMTVLKTITDQDFESATPSAWWDWWNEENDRYQTEKPTYTRYAVSADPVQVNYARSLPRRLLRRNSLGTHECFPAGTLVRTQTGFAEIESIQAGDRVLSKHTETGELTYKIVLATTVRPPSEMVTIGFEGGEIESTNGHLFWVEEHGWKMAKNLTYGDLIHGLDESRRVLSVVPREDAEAHNLVVAEFGTYFVGKEGILVHDNSERRRSNSITPGLSKVTR